jgi:hypothetical protein
MIWKKTTEITHIMQQFLSYEFVEMWIVYRNTRLQVSWKRNEGLNNLKWTSETFPLAGFHLFTSRSSFFIYRPLSYCISLSLSLFLHSLLAFKASAWVFGGSLARVGIGEPRNQRFFGKFSVYTCSSQVHETSWDSCKINIYISIGRRNSFFIIPSMFPTYQILSGLQALSVKIGYTEKNEMSVLLRSCILDVQACYHLH